MKRLLIGFSGKATAGKTTAAHIVQEHHGGVILAFADVLKLELYRFLSERDANELKALIEYSPEFDLHAYPKAPSGLDRSAAIKWINDNKPSVGNLMQLWGDYRRSTNPAYFIDKLCNQLEWMISSSQQNIYVDDVRYRTEAVALAELGFELIRVQASDGVREQRGNSRDPLHSSEIDLDAFWFQHIVFNNMEPHDLKRQLKTILEQINE